jgi:anion-transporting  ArsA/GET3 family ATPase
MSTDPTGPPTAVAPDGWADLRLHVVTGKGGAGKTTVSGALALALASGGRRVLVMEVEGRQGLAQLFDSPPLPYDEVRVAAVHDGGEVFALAVDAEQALLEYLDLFYKLGRAGRALERMGAVDFATTVAPGMRDVLLTGKAYEAVRRRMAGRRTYDAVVLDAPPTGRIARFLNVNGEVAGLAKVGPIRSQSDAIMSLIRSRHTAVHMVSQLEDMPVQETVDGVTELHDTGLPVGAVFVNMVRRPPLRAADLVAAAKGRIDRDEVADGLAAAGLPVGPDLVDALLTEAAEVAERSAMEKRLRRTLATLGRTVFELPFLPGGVDVGALYELAEELVEQGVGG